MLSHTKFPKLLVVLLSSPPLYFTTADLPQPCHLVHKHFFLSPEIKRNPKLHPSPILLMSPLIFFLFSYVYSWSIFLLFSVLTPCINFSSKYIFNLYSRYSELRRKIQVTASCSLNAPFTQLPHLLIAKVLKSHSLFLFSYCPFSIQCTEVWPRSLYLPFTFSQL